MKLRSDRSVTTAVRVARPLLASIFVLGGLDAFRHPASKAPLAAHQAHFFKNVAVLGGLLLIAASPRPRS